MKKLALLLGSILVATSVSAKEVVVVPEVVVVEPVVAEIVEATPALRATNVGVWTEYDRYMEGQSADGVYFGAKTGFATENWVFTFAARKVWSENANGDFDAAGSDRIDYRAKRNFNKDGEFKYSLGTGFRNEDEYDRYYLTGDYSYGMFSGWGYTGYTTNDADGGTKTLADGTEVLVTEADYWYSETVPVAITVGPVTVGYYLESMAYVGADAKEDFLQQELNIAFPLYEAETYSLGFQYDLGISQTQKGADEYDFADKHTFSINGSYQLTENSTLDAYYTFELTDLNGPTGTQKYGEAGLGWNYKF